MAVIDRAHWRQKLRNPSTRFIVLTVSAVVVVIAAALAPTVYTNGKAGYTALRRLDVEPPRGNVQPPETWIYPWFVEKITIMRSADEVSEWRPTTFTTDACSDSWLASRPNERYRDALRSACNDLHEIQKKYGGHCTIASCQIPDEARVELDGVQQRLTKAYEGTLLGGQLIEES